MITLNYLKENCDNIYYFGLGFIQIKVGSINYNFYTEKWGKVEDDIHTHKYGFKSEILKGTLTQHIYEEKKGNDFKKMLCDCKAGSEDEYIKNVNLEETIVMTLSKGSTYEVNENTIHKVYSTFCISKVEKGEYKTEKAAVYKPMSINEKVCPFFDVPEEDLWQEVERMINE